MANKKRTPYSKGKRWGFAVAKKQLGNGKFGVHKVDKAMKTCAQNARSGTKKLNQNERSAYRGIADGMYDAIMSEEKAQKSKPRPEKRFNRKLRASRHKLISRRYGSAKSNPKMKPVFDYSKYFDFDGRGRIKGSYIDGRFEPD